ncbi:hypothetical protein BWP39_29180 [Paraburkholderia acidicola]|uniref:YXWGXW repeat-containing protein n=1 Tax=Paraburkholderia acidicola TaxID=1912599 RepID=A0A2A4ESD9_9BURK|nr:hypothetical protein [Paraburkholderia acidicola]PCE23755.1 hypothetical protein BWP39_29180 [Paraburkholderia acidicola]
MKSRILLALCPALLVGALSGCVVAPVEPAAPPAGVVYVAPVEVAPAPGYVWRYHARYGWGWWHPHHGWYRGWR